MSKQIGIIIAVILVLIVLGVAGFNQMNKTKNNPSQVGNTQNISETTKGSIKSLIAAGKSVNCEVSYPESKMKGQTYVSGNKVRADFEATVESGKIIKTHMISDGTYSYMWTDDSKTGTKFKMDDEKPTTSSNNNQSQEAADFDQEVDLKCNGWSVDNSKFTVPNDIQFSDLSNMMKTGGNNAAPKMDSSICNQIEDPTAKASCISALNSN